jgi:hypothetical protein
MVFPAVGSVTQLIGTTGLLLTVLEVRRPTLLRAPAPTPLRGRIVLAIVLGGPPILVTVAVVRGSAARFVATRRLASLGPSQTDTRTSRPSLWALAPTLRRMLDSGAYAWASRSIHSLHVVRRYGSHLRRPACSIPMGSVAFGYWRALLFPFIGTKRERPLTLGWRQELTEVRTSLVGAEGSE